MQHFVHVISAYNNPIDSTKKHGYLPKKGNFLVCAVVNDEQMNSGWQTIFLLHDGQASNKVRVEHQPVVERKHTIFPGIIFEPTLGIRFKQDRTDRPSELRFLGELPNYRDLFTTTLLWFVTSDLHFLPWAMGFITIKPPFGSIWDNMFGTFKHLQRFEMVLDWNIDLLIPKMISMGFIESVVPPKFIRLILDMIFHMAATGTLGPQEKMHFSSWTSHDIIIYTPGKPTLHRELILGWSLGIRGNQSQPEKWPENDPGKSFF